MPAKLFAICGPKRRSSLVTLEALHSKEGLDPSSIRSHLRETFRALFCLKDLYCWVQWQRSWKYCPSSMFGWQRSGKATIFPDCPAHLSKQTKHWKRPAVRQPASTPRQKRIHRNYRAKSAQEADDLNDSDRDCLRYLLGENSDGAPLEDDAPEVIQSDLVTSFQWLVWAPRTRSSVQYHGAITGRTQMDPEMLLLPRCRGAQAHVCMEWPQAPSVHHQRCRKKSLGHNKGCWHWPEHAGVCSSARKAHTHGRVSLQGWH